MAALQGPQVHLTHQALDPLAVDRVAALLQLVTHTPAAVERQLEMDLVDEPHHSKVRLTATFRRCDGRTLHVRKATRAEAPQQAIYDALGVGSAPGGIRKNIV